ncbi:MAG: hypothetical protein LBB18_02765 [Puniceicoccales bacterium]|jgi:hypothetical protein|nr:hypothetical protein [Puniceicoccales bacterium]
MSNAVKFLITVSLSLLFSACANEIPINGIEGGAPQQGGASNRPWARPAAWEYSGPTISSSAMDSMGGGNRARTQEMLEKRKNKKTE